MWKATPSKSSMPAKGGTTGVDSGPDALMRNWARNVPFDSVETSHPSPSHSTAVTFAPVIVLSRRRCLAMTCSVYSCSSSCSANICVHAYGSDATEYSGDCTSTAAPG